MRSDSFDYIVVGAGSAGCVIAARLTESSGCRVLLLEAGGPDTNKSVKVPAAFKTLFKTDVDWAYHTEPEPGCKGRRMFWPRGKMLGGCHSLNAMLYLRGNRLDYDEWRDMGCEGWGYNDVLPYFTRSERNERLGAPFHGASGPLNVMDLEAPFPVTTAVGNAAAEAGFSRNDDFNGASQYGFGVFQSTRKNGQRHSVADAYLRPAMQRPNLTVVTHALTTRVLIEGGRARGVAYVHDGNETEATADREVVLCGGAINSPQLLMLSGVGPADQLRRHGIPVVADRPGVGQDLADHAIVVAAYECRGATLDNAGSFPDLARYLLFRSGPLRSPIAEAGGFVCTDSTLPAPDLQFHIAPCFFVNHGQTQMPGRGISIGPTLLRPRSLGRIELASSNPANAPRIFANYFADDVDLATLVEGVRIARRLAQQPALAAFRGAEVFPGDGVQTDQALSDFVREKAETLYHPAGTCKMGHGPDAVVDDALRVHGVQSLRVADASIMPVITRGNTNAPTIMIAEKAADLIRKDGA